MREEPDHYTILQVDPRAEREVIEAVYRRLAAKYHPDRDPSPGATDRMKLINAAYEVLSDPERRRAYDLRRGVFSRWGPAPPREDSRPSYSPSHLLTALALVALVVMAGAVRFPPSFLLLLGLLFLLSWLIWTWRGSKG